jgi:hypothetical protein
MTNLHSLRRERFKSTASIENHYDKTPTSVLFPIVIGMDRIKYQRQIQLHLQCWQIANSIDIFASSHRFFQTPKTMISYNDFCLRLSLVDTPKYMGVK